MAVVGSTVLIVIVINLLALLPMITQIRRKERTLTELVSTLVQRTLYVTVSAIAIPMMV